jgi:NADH-quinone oxidoreductase subunit E
MGYISQEATEWIAKQLMIEPIAVYELITFYPMFRQAPIGRKHVKVCRTLSCALAGSYHVCDRLQKALNCPLGGTSPDGEYTVEFVECLASCGTAPVVMVDEKLHENVKPENIDQWVSDAFPNHSKK